MDFQLGFLDDEGNIAVPLQDVDHAGPQKFKWHGQDMDSNEQTVCRDPLPFTQFIVLFERMSRGLHATKSSSSLQ